MWRKALPNVGILKLDSCILLNSKNVTLLGRGVQANSSLSSYYASSISAFTGESVIKPSSRRSLRHLVPVQDFSIGNRYFHIDQTNRFHVSSLVGSSTEQLDPANLSKNDYEEIAEETLDSLTGYFDEILERSTVTIKDADVSYGSGVLTIKLGSNGTYVINKQTPNKQVWLSSPTSGPKRYDFINKTWIYKHDGRSMYQLLTEEISIILQDSNINFGDNCAYGRAKC